MNHPPVFATVDPFREMTSSHPGVVRNLLGGTWLETEHVRDDLPDPLHGGDFLYPSLESQLWNGEQMIEALNFLDDLADALLDALARHRVAVQLADARVEEELQLEDALGAVHVLVGRDAADRRLVHLDVVGDVSQVQRLQMRDAMLEEVSLVADDALHHLVDRPLPLVDGLDQPQCGADLVLHVLARVLGHRAVLRQHVAAQRDAGRLARGDVEAAMPQAPETITGRERTIPSSATVPNDSICDGNSRRSWASITSTSRSLGTQPR